MEQIGIDQSWNRLWKLKRQNSGIDTILIWDLDLDIPNGKIDWMFRSQKGRRGCYLLGVSLHIGRFSRLCFVSSKSRFGYSEENFVGVRKKFRHAQEVTRPRLRTPWVVSWSQNNPENASNERVDRAVHVSRALSVREFGSTANGGAERRLEVFQAFANKDLPLYP